MIVITLCGLPGVGKSTLAWALALELRAPVLDKDRVREALFGPDFVEYSRAQDDHCCELLYSTAAWLSSRGDLAYAVLDGRTFLLPGQAELWIVRARAGGIDPRFVSCTAPREVALERIERDRSLGSHPARNRTRAHFEALEREARPLAFPHLVVDTDALDLANQVRLVREWIVT
jgi:predicted kinase